MLSKTRRLGRRKFVEVQHSRVNLRFGAFSVRLKLVSSTTPSRFAVVAGKSVARLATDRNKLRRRVYEIIQKHLSRFPQGIYAVVYVHKPLTYRALEKVLSSAFEQISNTILKQ